VIPNGLLNITGNKSAAELGAASRHILGALKDALYCIKKKSSYRGESVKLYKAMVG
jgi:hypothetical protein